ncbi:MAG: MiaB/RimO family radical SAM methylthiotransferase, partial [Kiritimatiellae bacterium]|nr:MiaB/RimO family radical SAM methylthiotransferase [Kiritimatiellia bacterium]
HRLAHLSAIIDRVLNGHGHILDAEENDERFDELAGHIQGSISAFVNILLGCERGCAYCVVPFVRGRERSRPAAEIIDEIRKIVAHGGIEVTLLGQSVMSYGRTNPVWPENYVSPMGFTEPLARLLEVVSGIEGVKRVRFTSGHPSGITAELVRAMSELPAVCEHLHLPLQSGSDRMLKMMRRGYTADDYRRSVDLLRSKINGMAFTTDVIVGFPTETVEEFEMTRQFMEEIGFDNSFIFKYSPRPGTPACELKDDVPASEKMRRNKVLLVVQDEMGLAINNRIVGQSVEVLVEGTSLRNQACWAGRTRTNKIVIFEPKPGIKPGEIMNVRIERAMPQTLYGKLI